MRVFRNHSGVTIVELLVVMAIVASVLGIGVMSINSLAANDLRSEAMRVSAVMRYTYANAALNNSRYRLVFDLDSGEYYTEVTDSALVETRNEADDDEFLTDEARELGRQDDEKNDLFDEEEADPFGINRKVTYQRVSDVVIEKTKLKEGIIFEKVYTAQREEPYEEGKAAMSFYPSGFQDQVMVVLANANDPEARITLMTEPMTGRVITFFDEDDIPDDFGEVERDE